MYDFNRALVSKVAWQLCRNNDKIWVKLIRSKYLWGRKLLDVERLPTAPSWIWGSITKCIALLKAGCCYQVGATTDTRTRFDPWLPNFTSFRPPSNISIPPQLYFVRDLMMDSGQQWNSERIRRIFPPHISTHILHTPILTTEQDRLIWTPSTTGEFSVKSAYKTLIQHRIPRTVHGIWKFIWKPHFHGHHNTLLWKIAIHALSTLDKIARVIPGISPMCYLCGEAIETVHHLFLTYLVTKLLWWQSPWQIRIEAFKDLDLNHWLMHIIGKDRYFPITELERKRMAVFMVVAYE